jgi:hypothetical protein
MSPRRADPKLKEKSQGLPTWAVAIAIGVVVCLAAIGLFLIQTPSTPAPTTGGSNSTATSRTQGDPNAKVELIEWSDFQ